MPNRATQSRRQFLKRSIQATSAGPLVAAASTLGLGKASAANDRITMACIGVGNRGMSNLNAFLYDERVEVVAVCDVDANHRAHAREVAELPEDKAFVNYEDVLALEGVDTVCISTPDHWHGMQVMHAARSGRDIYCEKPLSLTHSEGKRMVKDVRRYNRILQTGTHRRSMEGCRRACELVRSGYIGTLKTIHVGMPEGFAIRGGFTGMEDPMPVPDSLDYDRWLGPAPFREYTEARCHFNFRWIREYSAGYITDWGAHYYDIAQWGNGTDHTGPIAVDGQATFPEKGLYDAANSHRLEFTYANGVTMISTTTGDQSQWGMRFEGDEGSLFVESNEIVSTPESIASVELKPDDVHLYKAEDHHRNFVDCVLSREEPSAPVEIGHRSASICHIAGIRALLGRPLEWDPKNEHFPGDPEANAMLNRPKRHPYRL